MQVQGKPRAITKIVWHGLTVAKKGLDGDRAQPIVRECAGDGAATSDGWLRNKYDGGNAGTKFPRTLGQQAG